ncbi:hypothetical protein BT67DRAFT_52568 [Trichocladium antarcticum]|uniref:Uncharacterized protein n=1 Tax=Trichocladium antarcticum TaxID=1450529 RepID=A0AAN6ZC11_9PEZI|nr:hypothetical protein BT67DRAFT_52568 [Trichocladium antarcticum]
MFPRARSNPCSSSLSPAGLAPCKRDDIFNNNSGGREKKAEDVVGNGEWRTETCNVMCAHVNNVATTEMQTGNAKDCLRTADRPSDWTVSGCRAGCNLSGWGASQSPGELVRKGVSFADSRLHAVAVRGRASVLPNLGRLGRIEQWGCGSDKVPGMQLSCCHHPRQPRLLLTIVR